MFYNYFWNEFKSFGTNLKQNSIYKPDCKKTYWILLVGLLCISVTFSCNTYPSKALLMATQYVTLCPTSPTLSFLKRQGTSATCSSLSPRNNCRATKRLIISQILLHYTRFWQVKLADPARVGVKFSVMCANILVLKEQQCI